jgi:CubicO group peptidase (beta-lactamase class C family)
MNHSVWTAWVVSGALLLAGAAAKAQESAAPHDLAGDVGRELQAQGLQGAVWSLLGSDGGVQAGAAGVKDARNGRAMAPDDRVHVGSIAKTVLATGVLRLVSQGKLALDSPLGELLPQVAFDNPWSSSTPLRLRHLLDHTACLDDARLSQVFTLAPAADTPLAALIGHRPLVVRCRPGTRHSYSNTGYILIGMVVEAVTGERYEAWLRAQLLQPLGLHDSSFFFTTQAGPAADPRLAMGHLEQGRAEPAVPSALRPAGQFTTTAADMARLARFLMGDGRLDGQPFIDPALLAAMGRPEGTEAASAGLAVGYGLGLATRDRHGAVGRCHGGSTLGFRAMLCFFPSQQQAFFVAVNADVEGASYNGIDALLVKALGLQRAPPAATEAAALVDPSAWLGWYEPSPNRFASLAWVDATFGVSRLQHEGGLVWTPLGGTPQPLLHVAGALLRAPDRLLASHALIVADGGAERTVSTGLQTWRQVPLWVLLLRWAGALAAVFGLGWLLVAGGARWVAARWRRQGPPPSYLGIAVAGAGSLLLPIPLFLAQPFLRLGELTVASGLLAATTALLPLAMGVALVRLVVAKRGHRWHALAWLDLAALLGVLQGAAVLAAWGLLPLRLWA